MNISKIDLPELKSRINKFIKRPITYEEKIHDDGKPNNFKHERNGLKREPYSIKYRPNEFIRRVCLYEGLYEEDGEFIIVFETVETPEDGTEDSKKYWDLKGHLDVGPTGSFYDKFFHLLGKWIPYVIGPDEELPSEFVLEDTREVLFSSPEQVIDTKDDNASGKEAINSETIQKKRFPNIVAAINTGENMRWGDIKITFISLEEILVQYGEEHAERKFNHAGFEDGRDGKPIRAWTALCEAAYRHHGEFPYYKRRDQDRIERIVQELNEKLSKLFPHVSQKPIRLFKKDHLYKPAFQIFSNR